MKQIPAFYWDPSELDRLAERHREAFRTTPPFPHVVIDDFVPEEILDLLVAEFPTPDSSAWQRWGGGPTKPAPERSGDKLGCSDETQFGDFTRHFLGQLNSITFIRFLEKLTGTDKIVPDPSYSDCGLHSTGRGGRLMIHSDSDRHPIRGFFHQHYNLIFFVNPEWDDAWGGHLELWSRDRKECVAKVAPVANRAVIFDTGTRSYHGHPHPLTCPPDRRRNTLAVYYYVPERAYDEDYEEYRDNVEWVEVTDADRTYGRIDRFKRGVVRWIPPIVHDVYRSLRRR